ncbi:MAG: 3-dehydroquinate synthase [Desulfocapsaceae bacterium]|nr:3-dehydroquinate synthase [Desulfocapsaceae bacterium]
MIHLQVGLEERSYPIFIEEGCLQRVGPDLAERKIANRYCVVADNYVAELYGDRLMGSLADAGLPAELITFPRGEANKTLQTVGALASRMAGKGFGRKDGLLALGGGVTGDITGFLAASYMRGIPFIQIPTTLLAQVDSSVGGKTGVDIPEGKNLIGAFYQPKAVYIDMQVLSSLPREELLNGLAEVIKYAVIRSEEFFDFLQRHHEKILNLDVAVMEEMIHTCCSIKAEIVAADEREADFRRVLNFGHTIGHAVEAASAFAIPHGYAVAIGMVAVSRIAMAKGLLAEEEFSLIRSIIQKFGLPTEIPGDLSRDAIKSYLLTDKKTVSGRVYFVLPTSMDRIIITDEVTDQQIDNALREGLGP